MKTIRNFVSALLSVALFAVVLTAVVVAVPASATTVPAPPAVPLVAGPQNQQQSDSPKGFLTNVNITADVQSEYGYTDGSWDPGFLSMINTNYNEDYKTEETALVIDTAAELASFSKAVNGGLTFEDRFVSLGQNIDLEGIAPTITKDRLPDLEGEPAFEVNITEHAYNVWEPIGDRESVAFAGSFDGKGFAVLNMVVLKIQEFSYGSAGLFGVTTDGELKNVGVVNSAVIASSSYSSSSSAGGLVGKTASSITNSYTTGNVYSSAGTSSFVGGLVGQSSSFIIKSYAIAGVFSSCNLSSGFNSYAGGLVGSVLGPIKSSYATGNVYSYSSSSSYAGGLVGYLDSSSITNSYATGNAYSSSSASFSSAGGLVGYLDSSSITNSYATGNAYSSNLGSDAYAGGLVGKSYLEFITNSYAVGDVYCIGYTPYAGGLVGDSISSHIANSYATGDVYSSTYKVGSSSSSSYAGGLVGYSSSPVSNSYATGDVYSSSLGGGHDVTQCKSYAGGLVGYSASSVINSYSTSKSLTATGMCILYNTEYIGGLVGQNNGGEINQSYFDSTNVNYYGDGSANHDGLPESTGNLQSGNQPGLNTKPWTHPSGVYPTLDIIPAFETSYAPTYSIGDPIPDAQVTKGLSDLEPEYFIVDESPANFVAEIDRFTGEVTVLGPGTFKILALRVGGSEFQSQDVSVVSGTITISGDGPTPPPPPPPVDTVPVFRVFNPLSGEHHYTRDRNESETLIANGWNNEGTAWVSPKTGAPVYRVFNSASGEHHYTKDHNEFQTLVDRGWRDEGISWRSGGDTPVQRVFNPRSGEHHYTKDRNEARTLIADGWTDEGVAWMAVS